MKPKTILIQGKLFALEEVSLVDINNVAREKVKFLVNNRVFMQFEKLMSIVHYFVEQKRIRKMYRIINF